METSFGLRLRSCGENPIAAESLGVNVYTYKYIAVIVSGGLAGLGGAFLALVTSHIYHEGQTGGRGYIGLAAMIFGNWRPGGLAMGAGLFGFSDASSCATAASPSTRCCCCSWSSLALASRPGSCTARATSPAVISAVIAASCPALVPLTDDGARTSSSTPPRTS